MGNIIRRKKAVPVEARRVEPPPQTIRVPGAEPIPAPPQTPGVTQNIFYVNVPAGQPQSTAPVDPSPREVHYHTTNIFLPRGQRGRGTSFLGSLGFVLGCVAVGFAYLPPAMWLAKPIAIAGMALAGVGMLGAILLGRVGRAMPMLGLLVSAIAYGLWMKNTGQKLPIEIPKMDLNINATPPSVNTPAPSAPAKAEPAQDHSIFGDGQGNWTKLSDAPTPALVTPSPPMDLATATANLETAKIAAARQMGFDYESSKSAAANADAAYKQAKVDDSPGSAELIAASRAHLDADSQLNLIEIKLKQDPKVAAAEQALKNAKTLNR